MPLHSNNPSLSRRISNRSSGIEERTLVPCRQPASLLPSSNTSPTSRTSTPPFIPIPPTPLLTNKQKLQIPPEKTPHQHSLDQDPHPVGIGISVDFADFGEYGSYHVLGHYFCLLLAPESDCSYLVVLTYRR